MNFKTSIKQPSFEQKIEIEDKSFFIGSCFSNNICKKFEDHYLSAEVNPFGTVFNPISIQYQLEELISEERKDFFLEELDCKYYSLNHSSTFSGNSLPGLIEKITDTIHQSKIQVKKSNHVFITLGTAWVYQWKSNGNIVANCHKIPQKYFEKRLLTIDEIIQSLQKSIELLQKSNPLVNIVFTLSPVRHLKDGFTENALSKARLLEAIHQVVRSYSKVNYFPAYEIFMDDLRDYRFYDADMLHPNPVGIDYVWNIFKTAFFSTENIGWLKKLESLKRAKQHRPINQDSAQENKHQSFILEIKAEIKNRFPNLVV